jgi:peptide/nickel transport system permease protein/glutathione transport system permease protein
LFKYIIRRILWMIPTLWVMVSLVFVAIHLLPGDPAIAILGEYASAEALAKLREQLGVNRPLIIQYLSFLGNLLQGDLGTSLSNNKQVSWLIMRMLPYSAMLTISSMIVAIIIGVPVGILSALKRNHIIDYVARVLALLGFSTPTFYLGILLLLLFSLKLDIFPVIGGGDLDDPVSLLYHLVLPAFSGGLVTASIIVRMTRSTVLDVLQEDYIQTARSKGLHEMIVIYKHALRNALIPVIAVIGVYIGVALGTAVLTEIVYNRPGIGKLLVGAVYNRDYPTVQGTLVVFAAFIAFINLATDLAYGIADPRIRYD